MTLGCQAENPCISVHYIKCRPFSSDCTHEIFTATGDKNVRCAKISVIVAKTIGTLSSQENWPD